jgi:hypothetical protein
VLKAGSVAATPKVPGVERLAQASKIPGLAKVQPPIASAPVTPKQ